jgi:hypothetical protein
MNKSKKNKFCYKKTLVFLIIKSSAQTLVFKNYYKNIIKFQISLRMDLIIIFLIVNYGIFNWHDKTHISLIEKQTF